MFKKAERKQAKLKLAITGPSGSGKTYSALRMAKGLGEKVALIDTERGSASLYSSDFNFDAMELVPPYTTLKYNLAIDAAVKAGYQVLVIDSITHEWAGEGGLLEKKEALDKAGKGNSYTNWATITKEHESFKAKILNSEIHIICTMRSKQEYALAQGDNNKTTVQKLGMAPVQRDGAEYEFTTVFDVGMNHFCTVSKDRTKLFDGQVFMITEETGEALKTWLEQGKPIQVEKPATPPPANAQPAIKSIVSPKELNELVRFAKSKNFDQDFIKKFIITQYGISTLANLNQLQFEELKMFFEENDANDQDFNETPKFDSNEEVPF